MGFWQYWQNSDPLYYIYNPASTWAGAGDVLWDGTHLWVSDADSNGSNNTFHSLTNFIRVYDTSTLPPTLVTSIDTSGYYKENIRRLALSNDGTKVYACLKGRSVNPAVDLGVAASITKSGSIITLTGLGTRMLGTAVVGMTITISGAANSGNNGTFPIASWISTSSVTITNPSGSTDPSNGSVHWSLNPAAGRVLVFNKTTFAIVGNAVMTTGFIGSPSGFYASGARSCVEDNLGNLWVLNSSQSTSDIAEKFTLSTVLANGTSPTTSSATVNIASHADDLAFDGTFVWGAGYPYTTTLTRITPSTNAVAVCTHSGSGVNAMFGCRFLFGELWVSDWGSKVIKVNRSAFVGGGTANLVTSVLALTGGTVFLHDAFASDGTFLWVANYTSNATTVLYKINPTTMTVVNSIVPSPALTGNRGIVELCFDGTHMWGSLRYYSPPGLIRARVT